MDPGVPLVDGQGLADRLAGGGLVLVLFYADWCGFCNRFMGTFREAELPGEVVAVNLSSYQDPLWEAFSVDVVPTVVALRDGQVVARADGRRGRGLSSDDLSELRGTLAPRRGAQGQP